MLDMIIKGGTVVTASSTFEADIGVKDEQIVLIGAPGTIQGEARRIIDASGKYVMPGLIEPHMHAFTYFA